MTDEMLMMRPARCLTMRRADRLGEVERALEVGVDDRVPVLGSSCA